MRKEPIGVQGQLFTDIEVGFHDPSMKANELVGFWIDCQDTKVPEEQIRKQGKAASRICQKYTREQIAQASVGILQLYPHSNGEPWDLFDLERKFAKAMQGAVNHPEVQAIKRREELKAELGL